MNMTPNEVYTLLKHNLIPTKLTICWAERAGMKGYPEDILERNLRDESKYRRFTEMAFASYVICLVISFLMISYYAGNAVFTVSLVIALGFSTLFFAILHDECRRISTNDPFVRDLNDLANVFGVNYLVTLFYGNTSLDELADSTLRDMAKAILSIRHFYGETSDTARENSERFAKVHALLWRFNLAEKCDVKYFQGHNLDEVSPDIEGKQNQDTGDTRESSASPSAQKSDTEGTAFPEPAPSAG